MFLFIYYSFVDPETQACSFRELLLIVGFPVIIKLVITSALLGNLFFLHNNRCNDRAYSVQSYTEPTRCKRCLLTFQSHTACSVYDKQRFCDFILCNTTTLIKRFPPFNSVKFLAFPSEVSESPPPCGVKGNCTVLTQMPFLPKNPTNQTGNSTAGKITQGFGDWNKISLWRLGEMIITNSSAAWQLWPKV